MIKTIVRLTPRGNSLAVTVPKEILSSTGLREGDELALVARDDGVIEIHRAASDEATLDAAFDWVLGRYPRTLTDLAK